MTICSSRLTICSIAADGTDAGLEFLDPSGTAVAVQLPLGSIPFEDCQALGWHLHHEAQEAGETKEVDDETMLFGRVEFD